MEYHGFKVGQKVRVKSWSKLNSIMCMGDLHEVAQEYLKQLAGETVIIDKVVGDWIYVNANKNEFTRDNKHLIYLHPTEIEPAGINIEIDESLFEL